MLSVVIPARNEEENVEPMYRRLAAVLDEIGDKWEIIFSVDPSTDRTEEIVGGLCKRDKRVRMLRFSRRFGQPMAILAGMEASSGDAVVVIDCDMQDPPELIPELVRLWREGFDVVYAQRRSRDGETLPKRMVSALGYRALSRIAEVEIPPNTGEFRLMSRRVVHYVCSFEESHGFLRGLVGLVGFPQTGVLYDREARRAGSSKYNRFLGSVVIGLNVSAASDFVDGNRDIDTRLPSGARVFHRKGLGLSLSDRQPDDRNLSCILQRHSDAIPGRNG
jgi:polyisoprenyl-phosphate glycosyltransferase